MVDNQRASDVNFIYPYSELYFYMLRQRTKKKAKVLIFGTFDTIHPGHRWFLRKAGKMGEYLVAVIARDCFVMQWKGHLPQSDETTRMELLKESGLVDEVLLADETVGSYGVMRLIRPDIICLGHDQTALYEDLLHYLKNESSNESLPMIHILKPWRRWKYSSTLHNAQPVSKN